VSSTCCTADQTRLDAILYYAGTSGTHVKVTRYRYAKPRIRKGYAYKPLAKVLVLTFFPDKYSVILPTYNERKNLPVIVWLLAKTFDTQ
jgi:hypothetical protein